MHNYHWYIYISYIKSIQKYISLSNKIEVSYKSILNFLFLRRWVCILLIFFIFQRFSWDILSHVLLIDNMTIYTIKLKAGRGCAAYLSRRGCGCLIVKYIHNLMFTSFYCSVKEWAVFFFVFFFIAKVPS